jgi:hypothetical protein
VSSPARREQVIELLNCIPTKIFYYSRYPFSFSINLVYQPCDQTSDLDHPFRVYDTRTIGTAKDNPVALFGVANRKSPTPSIQRGGWVHTIFAHGLTENNMNEYVVLWELRKCKEPLQNIQLPSHTGTHCAFSQGGRNLVVTGNHHVSFLTL